MAQSKETRTAQNQEVSSPAATEAAGASPSPWEDMVSIRLFKDGDNYRDDVFVAVNGHNYQLQRGVSVQVPRCVADVLAHSQQQDHAATMLVEQLEREYSEKKD